MKIRNTMAMVWLTLSPPKAALVSSFHHLVMCTRDRFLLSLREMMT